MLLSLWVSLSHHQQQQRYHAFTFYSSQTIFVPHTTTDPYANTLTRRPARPRRVHPHRLLHQHRPRLLPLPAAAAAAAAAVEGTTTITM